MKPEQLRQLAALAEARKSRDLASLEAVVSEDRQLVEAIEAYARAPAQDFSEAGGNLPFAQMALRQQWADRNIAIAQQRRAELAMKIAELRKIAALSLGKHKALQDLTDRAVRESAQQRLARQEREALPPAGHKPGGV
jgi:hypothetical protein